MNAIDLLKQDHRNVEELFAKFLQLQGSEEEREQLFQQIQTELFVHGEAEEKVFYPLLMAEIPDQIDEALEEHLEIKEMLAELLDIDFDEEDFDTKFTAMMKAVQHNVEEEERTGGIMDIARQKISEENLINLANDIQILKRDIHDELVA
jgi:Hemerythrin HHE cation binding domain